LEEMKAEGISFGKKKTKTVEGLRNRAEEIDE
jgi:hypothetical protein